MENHFFILWCWNCGSLKVQKERLPAEIYQANDAVVLRTECDCCNMHNTFVLSQDQHKEAREFISKLTGVKRN